MSLGDDNKDQVLLNPVIIKSIDITDRMYEECQSLITDFHDTPIIGHKGVKATYNGLRKHYIWNVMKEQIQTYIKHCQKCQQSKVSNQKTSGSLIPLPTPSSPCVKFRSSPGQSSDEFWIKGTRMGEQRLA